MFTSQATSLVDYSDSDDSMEVAQEKVRKENMPLRHRYCECHYMIHKCFTFYLFQTMSRKVDNNTFTYIYYQLDSESDSSGPYHSDSTLVDETDDPDSLKAHSSEQSYFVPELRKKKSILVGI